ncbi:MAG: LysR family transcriptional regulator [Proteobacteria bacterium]|nr:LysR family transcriptional regulator [Pseudomonadota bacterium]
MNPILLRAFWLVAKEGGFSRAARKARVSQPTLSAQVKALEQRYATPLFVRQGRAIRLTPAGRRLLDVAERYMALADEAEAAIQGASGGARVFLNVAADGPGPALAVLKSWRATLPDLGFALAIGNSEDVARKLLAYEADVGILAKAIADPRLTLEPLKRDRLVAFVPITDPRAKRKRIRLADVAAGPVILRERGSVTRERFETGLAAARLQLGPAVEVATREGVAEAVAAGFGVGLVFESELAPDPRFAKLTFADAELDVGEYLACLAERRRQPAIDGFFAAATELFGRN